MFFELIQYLKIGHFYLKKVSSIDVNFNLFSIYPKEETLKSYYRYAGSLTTPPCSEVVIWNVFENPINISSSQVIIY